MVNGVTLKCTQCGRSFEAHASAGQSITCPDCRAAAKADKQSAIVASHDTKTSVSALKIWLALLLLALAAYGGYSGWRILNTYFAERGGQQKTRFFSTDELDFLIPEFQLAESSGKTFNSKDMTGQVWVVSFFFAQCPGFCAMMNQQIADLLAGEFKDLPVTFVSVSVDPQNDTPKALAAHAQDKFLGPRKIDPRRWLFLTSADGSVDAIRIVSEEYFKLPFSRSTHTERWALVDGQGRVRGYYLSTEPAQIERLKRKINELLKEPKARKDAA
jgi:protein SCO1/2